MERTRPIKISSVASSPQRIIRQDVPQGPPQRGSTVMPILDLSAIKVPSAASQVGSVSSEVRGVISSIQPPVVDAAPSRVSRAAEKTPIYRMEEPVVRSSRLGDLSDTVQEQPARSSRLSQPAEDRLSQEQPARLSQPVESRLPQEQPARSSRLSQPAEDRLSQEQPARSSRLSQPAEDRLPQEQPARSSRLSQPVESRLHQEQPARSSRLSQPVESRPSRLPQEQPARSRRSSRLPRDPTVPNQEQAPVILTPKTVTLKNLQRFVFAVIVPLIEDDVKKKPLLVSASAMKVWRATFTDSTFNPNRDMNYESLEKLGDAILKVVFIQYILTLMPDLDEDQMSQLVFFYLSKPALADISFRYKFPDYVQTYLDKNPHMAEDVLEAVFGAVLEIGNSISLGIGYIYCYNLVSSMFSGVTLDMNVTKGHSKTQVKEVFDKMSWGAADELESYDQDSTIIDIMLNEYAIRDLRNKGIRIDSLLGRGISSTSRKLASNDAYTNALAYLNATGITSEWVEKNKPSSNYNDTELSELHRQAVDKASVSGYNDVVVVISRTTQRTRYTQVIGVLPNGRKDTLVTVSSSNEESAKKEALNAYLAL